MGHTHAQMPLNGRGYPTKKDDSPNLAAVAGSLAWLVGIALILGGQGNAILLGVGLVAMTAGAWWNGKASK